MHTTLERARTTFPLSPARPAAEAVIPAGALLGRIGPLEVRLARNSSEIAAAQEVRFRVFYDELGAKRDYVHELEALDADRFDAICDHLVVFDTAISGPDHRQIVGTYRLLRQEAASVAGGFYSSDEFEMDVLVARHPGRRFLELGRSCVLPEYRTKRTVELLWQGIWAYARRHGVDVMTGCASFPGVIPAAHAEALSFLAHHCAADADWHTRAVSARFHTMDLMPVEAVNQKAALLAMPPLIKGYLRLGARFGEGCVVDRDFGTTDVFVILPVERISERYINYYGAEATRFAA
ncbi:GNAT family N-acetyltransferase [Mesorhizobium australicum]|uniref:L-ornithine N(alpha)-acyltransferase n=1 Tax=Mesorhizobium australicum TaxID=536018 RepID=A0A1X7NFW4_9HYPH|nr:GNAT family N-acetyltransferase [Mesorhizobium australicum]SMH35779.1 ornithine-acyl[acyl carrier protein] N-acyltransferase [Mesorhizobium australicum]